jgi:hypothetical protein
MRRTCFGKAAVADLVESLPVVGAVFWTAQRKAAVVLAIRTGVLSQSEAYRRYMLSNEELREWEQGFDRDGLAGLFAKRQGGVITDADRVVSRKKGPGRPTKVSASAHERRT